MENKKMRYKIINVEILRPRNPEVEGMSTHLLGIDLWIPEGMEGLHGNWLTEGELIEEDHISAGPNAYRLIRTEGTPGRPYPHFSAEPVKDKDIPNLFGGNYIWSDDIEFRDICGYPIEVHD